MMQQEYIHYRITLKGELQAGVEKWFEEMNIERRGGSTILTGKLLDQSELHGLLNKIHDLHLTLESVESLPSEG